MEIFIAKYWKSNFGAIPKNRDSDWTNVEYQYDARTRQFYDRETLS